MRTITTPGRYGDGGGLYLVVDRSGARRWVVRLVVRGTRHDLGLGSASAVSLAEARAEAARLRALARRGGDPLADRRRAQRPVPTVREAAIQVHAQRAVTFRSAKHRHQWLQSLAQAVFPVLGDRPVDAVTSSDILAVLTPIWTTTPETARRVKQRLKVIFEWAVAAGYRPAALANPVEGVTRVLPRPPRERAHHPALPYAQVPALLQTLATVEAYEPTKLAFEFLILTAARTSEVLGARWDEIDRDARLWVIPGTRTKAGRAHRVPLAPRCLALLDRAAALSDGGPYVFPGHRPQRPLSVMAFLRLLRRLTRERVVVHGFRASFRDWAAERTRFPHAVCEAALAHAVKDPTEAAYFRSDLLDQRRALMEAWAAFCLAIPAEVVPIRA